MADRKKKNVKFITYKGRVIPVKKKETYLAKKRTKISKQIKKEAKEKGYRSTATFSTVGAGLGIAGVGSYLNEIASASSKASKKVENILGKNYKKPKVSSLASLKTTKRQMSAAELSRLIRRKGVKTKFLPYGLRLKRRVGHFAKATAKATKYGSRTTKVGLAIAGVGLAAEGVLRAFED